MGRRADILKPPLVSAEFHKGNISTSGIDKGSLTWPDPPNITTTVRAKLQPATTQSQQMAGIEVKAGRFTLFSESVEAKPTTYRVSISSILYDIISVSNWPGHSELTLEAVH